VNAFWNKSLTGRNQQTPNHNVAATAAAAAAGIEHFLEIDDIPIQYNQRLIITNVSLSVK
jgi:hypothetical protein